MDHCLQPYLGDAQCAHILTVGGGAIPCPPGPCQQAAQALDADASVDGVLRRGWWGEEDVFSLSIKMLLE